MVADWQVISPERAEDGPDRHANYRHILECIVDPATVAAIMRLVENADVRAGDMPAREP